MIVVPLLPGQSRDRVREGDDWMSYVSLGPSVMVGELSEEEKEEEEIGNDDAELVVLEADCRTNTVVPESIAVSLLIKEAFLEVGLALVFSFFTRLPTMPLTTAVLMMAAPRTIERMIVDLRGLRGRVLSS